MNCNNCIMHEGDGQYIWCILRKMHYARDHTCHAWCSSGLIPGDAMERYEKLILAGVAVMRRKGNSYRDENDLIRLVMARAKMRKKAEKEVG